MINYYTRSLIGQRIDRFETTKTFIVKVKKPVVKQQ